MERLTNAIWDNLFRGSNTEQADLPAKKMLDEVNEIQRSKLSRTCDGTESVGCSPVRFIQAQDMEFPQRTEPVEVQLRTGDVFSQENGVQRLKLGHEDATIEVASDGTYSVFDGDGTRLRGIANGRYTSYGFGVHAVRPNFEGFQFIELSGDSSVVLTHQGIAKLTRSPGLYNRPVTYSFTLGMSSR